MLSLGPSGRRWVLLVAAVLASAVTARLGWWQLDRAQQKTDLQLRIQSRAALPPLPQADLPRDAGLAEAWHYRPTVLRGRWLASATVYLDNRQMNARQGFFVLTPLLLSGGDAVLVQRGWMPRDFSDRKRLQPLPEQGGEVLVTGRLAPPPSRLLALSGDAAGAIRQNLDLEAYAREIGVGLRPLSVQQTAATQALAASAAALPDDGLLRQWSQPALDLGKHHGYAFQWFSLSALVLGLTAWFQFLRPRLRRPSAQSPETPETPQSSPTPQPPPSA